VVPASTLAAAQPGQQSVSCGPAWPAATFVEPGDAQDAPIRVPGRRRGTLAGLLMGTGRLIMTLRYGCRWRNEDDGAREPPGRQEK
jgi:hypothetical protein